MSNLEGDLSLYRFLTSYIFCNNDQNTGFFAITYNFADINYKVMITIYNHAFSVRCNEQKITILLLSRYISALHIYAKYNPPLDIVESVD